MPDKDNNKSRVLYATFQEIPSPTGTACWAAEEIRELAAHYHLDVLSLKSEELSHIERFNGARLLRVPVGSGPFLSRVKAFQRALSRQLDSEDYRLCHFTSIWEGMTLASRKKGAGFKLVYEVHGLASVDFRSAHPEDVKAVEQSYPLKQQEERCLSSADLVLAGSQHLADHLQKRGVSREKLRVLRPAIDQRPFTEAPTEPGASGTVLYLGSLMPWQGIHPLLAAMNELPHQIPARLLLVAPKQQPFLREVQGKIQMMGLARKVEILDPVPFENLPALLARANVCVAPLGNHEHNRLAASTPHKLLVYMAASKAVVASRQPVVHELMEDGIHAVLHTPSDSRELAEAIKTLLLDKELSTRLGNQARLRLEETLSLAGQMGQLLAMYRELIGDSVQDPTVRTEGDTWPHMRQKGAEDVPDCHYLTDDTAPVRLPGDAQTDELPFLARDEETDPKIFSDGEGNELVFKSVEQEDTAPRNLPKNADEWKVMELSDVRLPQEPPAESEKEGQKRWLLGGPPYPVDADGPDIFKRPTKRASQELTPTDLALISDSDVKIIEPEEIEALEEDHPLADGKKKPKS